MLVVNMRSVPALTQFQLPTAKELQKLKEKSLLVYVIVGKSGKEPAENQAPIQLNNGFTTLDAMPEELQKIKVETKLEDRDKMVVIMKIDKNTPMGLVNDIRQILREQHLLTVYYAAEKPQK
jgi:biopolymer transport protein ExbD